MGEILPCSKLTAELFDTVLIDILQVWYVSKDNAIYCVLAVIYSYSGSCNMSFYVIL